MRHPAPAAILTLAPAALAAALGLGGCQSGHAGHAGPAAAVAPPVTRDAQAAFDRVKALAGTWEMTDEQGTRQTALVIRVISNGSAVHESMFGGSDHEMVNVYHLDGDRVVVTHYCGNGNQPRMACSRVNPDGSLTFTLDTIANLQSADTEFMGGLTLIPQGPDRLVQDWQSRRLTGPLGEHARFELTRKAG